MTWLTVADIAAEVRETPHTIAKRCASGEIRATKLGSGWRVRQEDFEAWMQPTNVKTPRVRSTAQKRRAS